MSSEAQERSSSPPVAEALLIVVDSSPVAAAAAIIPASAYADEPPRGSPPPPPPASSSTHSEPAAILSVGVGEPLHSEADGRAEPRALPVAASDESWSASAGERAEGPSGQPPAAEIGQRSQAPGAEAAYSTGATILYAGGSAGDDGEADSATATLVVRPRNPPDHAPILALGNQ